MSEKRWVLMQNGTPQTEFLGKTELNDQDIEEMIAEGRAVVLEECRCLRTLLIPGPEGVAQSNMLTSNSVARGGINFHIRPTSWWWPDEDAHAMEVLTKQLAACEQSELQQRAKESGLVTPGGNPVSDEVARQIKARGLADGFKGRL